MVMVEEVKEERKRTGRKWEQEEEGFEAPRGTHNPSQLARPETGQQHGCLPEFDRPKSVGG